jgi:phenylpyruvate tautomerase PptA (4-oxalocrotonate tautomerase family)
LSGRNDRRRRAKIQEINMPLLKLETTVALTEDKRQALLASLSKIVAETIGKPQQYVMVTAS